MSVSLFFRPSVNVINQSVCLHARKGHQRYQQRVDLILKVFIIETPVQCTYYSLSSIQFSRVAFVERRYIKMEVVVNSWLDLSVRRRKKIHKKSSSSEHMAEK